MYRCFTLGYWRRTGVQIASTNKALTALGQGIYQLSLDAEVAYQQGKMAEADQYGQQAIAESKGVQKYLMIKTLEKNKRNPHRNSYF